jgi:nitrogen fixation/metabolism regulation signal transduction histidine kinase
VSQEQRTKVWIDNFQTRLTLRIGLYLVGFIIVVVNSLLAWSLIEYGAGNLVQQLLELLNRYLAVWVCLFLLVPVMAWDAIRFTHRIVGPIVRFRRVVRDIAQGEPVRPIKLRAGDFLTEFRDEFNEMLIALERRGVAVLKPLDPSVEPANSQRTPA